MNEPLYRSYAKQMLGVDQISSELESNLAYAERLIKKVKPCAFLSSTQTIASIILLTEVENKINSCR